MQPVHSKRLPIFTCLMLVFMVSGCVTFATDYRKVGFDEIQKGFSILYKPSALNEIIRLKNVTIHIVGDRSLFKWAKAANYGSPVAAYATTNNEIWLFGAMVKGRIVLNQAILGHEFNHLLQFNHPTVVHNPDKLDDIGA